MTLCEQIERELSETGLTQAKHQAHIDSCPHCQQLISDLRQLDAQLDQLPSYDAPAEVIAKTLKALGQTPSDNKPVSFTSQRRWAAGLAAAALIFAVIGLDPMTYYQRFIPTSLPLSEPTFKDEAVVSTPRLADREYAPASLEEESAPAPPITTNEQFTFNQPADSPARPEAKRERRMLPQSSVSSLDQDGLSSRASEQTIAELDTLAPSSGAYYASNDAVASEPEPALPQTKAPSIDGRVMGGFGGRTDSQAAAKPDAVLGNSGALNEGLERRKRDQAAPKPSPMKAPAEPGKKIAPASMIPALSSAQEFLRQRESLENLNVQPATGYWANTYIPGDPILRRLHAQLSNWQRPPQARLEQQVSANRQPFDPPENAAIGLYLHADKKAIAAPSRVRLQVGLKGALRRAGQRPAMSIGIVLDLRGTDYASDGPTLRAVLEALVQAKQAGDQFSLTIAGPAGGLMLPPEQFRHGPLSVNLSRLLLEPPATEPAINLTTALEIAAAQVASSDDPDAPLGSSMLLLIATAPINSELAELERIAHTNAVAGIALSALNVGSEPATLQRLVLAGQGSLRAVNAPDQAKAVIEQELFSASRAVARALRLRIRLAPGVKLVDILGSYRLDDPAAQRVREAEQSIDQRLARNLGIQTDRGEDEEGIQIVIPQFHAAAEHVIVLDVLAPGAGPVADVRLRYKDLVYARNNSASAQLSLANGVQPLGPLERNVIKNELSLRLTQTLQSAAKHITQQQHQTALAALTQMQQLLQELRQSFPAWRNDAELLADEQLLADYARAINSRTETTGLSASLRYAAYRRLLGETLSE